MAEFSKFIFVENALVFRVKFEQCSDFVIIVNVAERPSVSDIVTSESLENYILTELCDYRRNKIVDGLA